MNVILEVNGKVKEKIVVTDQGVTIGRSWNNDVILTDRYVDPNQAKLSLIDDSLIIEDLNSTNGTEVSGKRINGKGVAYNIGDYINVGDTVVRLLNVTSEVSKTKRRSIWFHLVRFFKPLPLLALLLVIAGGSYVFWIWAFSILQYSMADAASDFFESVSLIFVLAAFFAILNKLFKGTSSFKEHLIVVSFIFIFKETADFIVWVIRFNIQYNSFGEILAMSLQTFVTTLFIVGALSYITQLNKLGVWLIALLCSASLFYSDNSSKFSRQDYENWTPYSDTETRALPRSYLLRDEVDLDSYLKESDLLFEKVMNAK